MSFLKHWLGNKPLGFSLLELMVVVAILGVLATVAVPRFNIFRARSRQAEAKSNLGVIYTLQESFAIDHELYYDGVKAKWGGVDMHQAGNRYGYGGSGQDGCVQTRTTNKLGFRMANCPKARYGYFINGGGENGFLAIAYAASDVAGDKRVFPGCEGNQPATSKTASDKTGGIAGCSTGNATGRKATEDTFTTGDAWCMDENRDLKNYRDISEFCVN